MTFFIHLTFFYKQMNIFIDIGYISVQKILWSFILSLQKKYFLSFHSTNFHSKIHKHHGTIFEKGWDNSLKRAYVEQGGTCKTNREKWGDREGGSKMRKFSSEHTFWTTQSLFATAMIYDMLIFNLIHSHFLITL